MDLRMGNPMGLGIATSSGQWALDRLVARYSEFRSATVNDFHTYQPGRHYRTQEGMYYGNAIVDLVAIAESFSVSRLVLIRQVEENRLRSWKSRQKAWIDLASTNLEDFPMWPSLIGFVETRNALQHGLGKLTDFQLGKHKEEIFNQLASAGVQRNGGELLVSLKNTSSAMEICRLFISWLDVTAPLE